MTPDVIVVGSGMSGAPAAWLLSERGHNVLIIAPEFEDEPRKEKDVFTRSCD